MSGCSDSTPCPNCQCQANRYTDWKPFDIVSVECKECGFYVTTKAGFMDLTELNEVRVSDDMEELSQLPKQDKSLIGE